jgi:hypothetical protein
MGTNILPNGSAYSRLVLIFKAQHGDYDASCADFFSGEHIYHVYYYKRLISSLYIYMISTCAWIDKYTFYLNFIGVLSSIPQMSVIVTRIKIKNSIHFNSVIWFSESHVLRSFAELPFAVLFNRVAKCLLFSGLRSYLGQNFL